MDATTASGENGFDAALRALEDLETSVAQARDEKPAAVDATPAAAATIGFSDAGDAGASTAITAVPVAELEELIASGVLQPSPEPAPALAATAAPAASAPAFVTSPMVAPLPVAESPVAAPANPVGPDSAPAADAAEPVRPAPASGRLARIAVGLGLVSSIVSAAGLVIAERTIMSAHLVVADAREKQRQLETATQLIRDLRVVRDQQVALLRAQQAQLASAPVTSAELQHRMEALQAGLLERDPLTAVVRAVNEGQLSNNQRFTEIARKLDRLEGSSAEH